MSIDTKNDENFLSILGQWNATKSDLEIAKASELELRKAALAQAFEWEEGAEMKGSKTTPLPNGFKAKGEFKIYSKLENKAGETEAALNRICELDPENGPGIARRLVKWKPELSETEYKALGPEAKAIIDTVLTTKPGTPSLSIVPPKK